MDKDSPLIKKRITEIKLLETLPCTADKDKKNIFI
jgi:hypothetical protein